MSRASLELQSRKIEEFRKLEKPYSKRLAGLKVEVLPDVYPGGTDSELLCDSLKIKKGDAVLDLCTGNGIVALFASKMGASKVIGTDLNPAAVNNANLNKDNLGVSNVTFIEANLYPDTNELFDLVTINPPYTDNQAPDKTAICFWDKDNSVVKTFFEKLTHHLKSGGRAYMTWSSFADQELPVRLASDNRLKIKQISARSGKSGFEYYVYEIAAI